VFRFTWRGVRSRKLRLLLTALSISLGVAFVAGTFILTDTTKYAFDNFFQHTTSKVDVVIRAGTAAQRNASFTLAQPIDDKVVDQVANMPGVSLAAGEVEGYAQFVDKRGAAVTTSGAPTLGVSITPNAAEMSSWTLRTGRAPNGPEEMAVDAATARTNDFHVGDQVTVLLQDGKKTFTVVGLFGFGDLDSMAGATVAVFDLPTAQQLFNKVGTVDSISVRAQPGVSADDLRARIASTLGDHYDVVTGATDSQRTADAITSALSIFNTVLLVFAGVALFVGAFIIFNTFSILVAQRTRELGLVRALGASTTQVVAAVLGEALVVGIVSSVAGLVLGAVVASGLFAALKAFGMELPSANLQYEPRTIVVAFAVGIGVTAVAALVPALRTRAVSPLAALNSGLTSEEARLRPARVLGGSLTLAAGVAVLLWGMFGTVFNTLAVIAIGGILALLGAATLSPYLARPVSRAVGWPIAKLLGVPGRLGRSNAMRRPARTSRTASALMVGIGLVTFVAVMGDSLKATTVGAIDRVVRADYIVQPQGSSFAAGGFSPQLADRLRAVPQVSNVVPITSGIWMRNGTSEVVAGADAVALATMFDTTTVSGDLAAETTGGLAVSESAATANNLRVGERVTVTFPSEGDVTLPVAAIFKVDGTNVDFIVSPETFSKGFATQLDSTVAITLKADADRTAANAALTSIAADYPNAKLLDNTAYKRAQVDQVNQLLGLIYTLLALALLIALLGIMNTLALAVIERTRELGLLRAIGLSRGGIRTMVRLEAAIVATFGALLGVVIGVAFGWMAVQAMGRTSTMDFSIPLGQLAVFVVLGALGGVIAAGWPARRAARTDILRAVSAV
jgi:putative ABC transport system permease protein